MEPITFPGAGYTASGYHFTPRYGVGLSVCPDYMYTATGQIVSPPSESVRSTIQFWETGSFALPRMCLLLLYLT